MRFGDFASLMARDGDGDGGTAGYVKDWHFRLDFPDEAERLMPVPAFFEDDWLNEFVRSAMRPATDYHFIYLGGAGSTTTSGRTPPLRPNPRHAVGAVARNCSGVAGSANVDAGGLSTSQRPSSRERSATPRAPWTGSRSATRSHCARG